MCQTRRVYCIAMPAEAQAASGTESKQQKATARHTRFFRSAAEEGVAMVQSGSKPW